jgi:hypothetical protein
MSELDSLTRDELNARASAAGIDAPESLPNKQAVIDAVRAVSSPERPASSLTARRARALRLRRRRRGR